MLFSFYAILTGRTAFTLLGVKIRATFPGKERLTLILRRAQAVHLVRTVRRSRGPRTAISRLNVGNFLHSAQETAWECLLTPRLNGAATGHKLEATKDIRVGLGSRLNQHRSASPNSNPIYCFVYGNSRLIVLPGTGKSNLILYESFCST